MSNGISKNKNKCLGYNVTYYYQPYNNNSK